MTDSKKPLNQTDLLVQPNHGLDQSGSGQGQVVGSCECGDEPRVP
jgi:hypothetical protein